MIDRLHALRKAKSVEDAKAVLEQLRLEPLTETFRVEGLCDLLEGLGQGLLLRFTPRPGRVFTLRTSWSTSKPSPTR